MFIIFFGRSDSMNALGGIFFIIGLAVMPLLMILAVGTLWLHELSTETRYQHQYGDAWVEHYEEDQGPISTGRTRLWLGGTGVIALTAAYIYACKQIVPALRGRSGSGRRRRKRRSESSRAAAAGRG